MNSVDLPYSFTLYYLTLSFPHSFPLSPSISAEKNEGTVEVAERVITVSDSALEHLKDLRTKQGVDHLYLRMGVRSGGCSGMSYVLDVMKKEVRALLRPIPPSFPPLPPPHFCAAAVAVTDFKIYIFQIIDDLKSDW